MSIDITIERQNDVTVIAVEGSVDALTADTFLEALQKEMDEGTPRLVADLERVNYASSAGLRALLVGLKDSRQKGGDLRVAAVQKGVYRVLELSGFTSILKVYPDVEAAVASFSESE